MMMTVWQIKTSLSMILAFSSALLAPGISGTVKLSDKAAADVVVSVENLKLKLPAPQTNFVLEHRDLTFTPHVIVLQTGSTVRFENRDGMPCRIYSISKAGHFVIRPQEGKPVSITFDRPGVVEIRCADHEQMYAYIVVKENPYFALTDQHGKFQIPDLPAGTYVIQAWYEGKAVGKKTITVQDKEIVVDFQAALPQPEPRRTRIQNLDLFESLPTLGSARMVPGSARMVPGSARMVPGSARMVPGSARILRAFPTFGSARPERSRSSAFLRAFSFDSTFTSFWLPIHRAL